MTGDERLALALGDRLEQLNARRAHLARRHVDPMTAGGAAFIMWAAEMDRGRRALRAELAEVLGRIPAAAAHAGREISAGYSSDYRGQHARR